MQILPHPWLQGERSVPFDESGILPVNWRRRGSSPANRGVPHFFDDIAATAEIELPTASLCGIPGAPLLSA
jgi:hypothetical protein